MTSGGHCSRCAPHLVRDPVAPGQVDLDSPVLKEDLAAVLAAVDRCRNAPADILAAAREARGMADHVDGLDRILSAIAQHGRAPDHVAEAFNTASIHFGLGSSDWLFPEAPSDA